MLMRRSIIPGDASSLAGRDNVEYRLGIIVKYITSDFQLYVFSPYHQVTVREHVLNKSKVSHCKLMRDDKHSEKFVRF